MAQQKRISLITGPAIFSTSGDIWQHLVTSADGFPQDMVRRTEAARSYRDQHIARLEALPNRSRREQQQLDTLLLEKRFQQRIELGGDEDDEENDDDDDNLVSVGGGGVGGGRRGWYVVGPIGEEGELYIMVVGVRSRLIGGILGDVGSVTL